jgi:hypothetical protein
VVTAGQTATYNLQISPAGGFAGNVAITCAGAPGLANCVASPANVDVTGTVPVAFMVNVTTAAANAGLVLPERAGPGDRADAGPRSDYSVQRPSFATLYGMIEAMIILYFVFAFGKRAGCHRRAIELMRAFVLVLLLGAVFAACGGGGGGGSQDTYSPGTPQGNYTLTVTGTNQGVTRTAQLTLSVQ